MMAPDWMNRRDFLHRTVAGVGAAALIGERAFADVAARPDYNGPNIIIVRFGGGVRRRETIDPDHTYAPFLCHELTKRGVLFPKMEIEQFADINTSHGEGTLYILTGKYEKYKDVDGRLLGARFESQVPTLFEYMRKSYNVPDYQTLIINGEDRTDEEFYSFSNHHLFGASYRSNTLSLYRYKVFLLREQIARRDMPEAELRKKQKELAKMEALDRRVTEREAQSPEVTGFWDRWRQFYGESGFVNPRGDQLLAELASRALRELQPRLMMVNFNDPDYVHWGNPTHYTRGISIIDRNIERLVREVEADEFYSGNTIFCIVPDCGRDNNRAMEVPFQHHFNSRTSHEIFGLFFGPGIARGEVVDKAVQQTSVAATIGALMNAPAKHAESPVLDAVFA